MEPNDCPNAFDIRNAAEFVRNCAHALDANGFGLGATVTPSMVKLVIDAAWHIRRDRLYREEEAYRATVSP